MDFDDLDAEADERRARGEELDAATLAAIGGADPPGMWRGGLLPPILFCPPGLPGPADLPARVKQLLDNRDRTCSKIQLYIFYGAGDSFATLYVSCHC